MTDHTSLITTYIDSWNETDAGRRRELVARACTDDATYLDPIMSGEGIDGIAAMIAGVQQQYPGHRFELAQGPDAHHDRIRFTWHLVPEKGQTPLATGYDFGVLSADGRLQSVTGFLDVAAHE